MLKNPKPKKCKNPQCGEVFTPRNSLQKTCWKVECALAVGQKELERRKKQEQKEFRAETKRRKEKVKSRADWLKEAQQVFNKYIRLRDAALPCICCGEWANEDWKPGGSWDAGHFRSVGAHPELRFEELNCHKQLKSCNSGEGKFGKFHGNSRTVSKRYKERLPAKIGQEAYDWLMGPHEPKHYTIDDLKAIKAEYTKKIKEIEGDR